MKTFIKLLFIPLLFTCLIMGVVACSNDDDVSVVRVEPEETPEEEVPTEAPMEEETPVEEAPTTEEEMPTEEEPPMEEMPMDEGCDTNKVFVESNGIVRVDIENPSTTPNGWETATQISGFTGNGYLVWTGSDNFSMPGQGIITFPVKITTPGTYQFVWRSRITIGDSNTEHNDSWLKIQGDDFFGEKAATGELVFPRGSGKTPNPEGASRDGWLKAYMNRLNTWFWRSSTNDNDPFDIFVTFNAAGTYNVQISGRSNGHAIDEFVLFRTDRTLGQAQVAAFSEITCE
jgi:hypothetical protein